MSFYETERIVNKNKHLEDKARLQNEQKAERGEWDLRTSPSVNVHDMLTLLKHLGYKIIVTDVNKISISKD